MYIIAIVNQKGGCGKTTTAINLSAALGQQGARVLLIDMDPQGHASMGLGVAGIELAGLYEVLKGEHRLDEVIQSGVTQGVDLVPGSISLAAAEHLLADQPDRDRQLARHLEMLEARYDYIVLDCPPALGLLSVNALRAADRVLIPVEPSLYSLDGIERLRETIHLLAGQYDIQPSVTLLANMFDTRTRNSRNMLEILESQLPVDLCATRIRNSVLVREAASHGAPLTDHAPRAPVTGDFRGLAEELIDPVLQRALSKKLQASETRATTTPAAGPDAETDHLKEVVFRFDKSRRVQIAGEFNNWIPDKNVETDIQDGFQQKIVRVSPGGYEYRLIIDGVWQQDPANPEARPNDMGGYNSLLNV